jgi:hypothetical protein
LVVTPSAIPQSTHFLISSVPILFLREVEDTGYPGSRKTPRSRSLRKFSLRCKTRSIVRGLGSGRTCKACNSKSGFDITARRPESPFGFAQGPHEEEEENNKAISGGSH